MTRLESILLALTTLAAATGPRPASAEDKSYALETRDGLVLHNVSAEPVTHQGRKGLRVTISKDAVARIKAMTPEQRAVIESSR